MGKEKIQTLTERKKNNKDFLLVFPSQKECVFSRTCFLLVSKQLLLLEDLSPSVIKSFMLKQYKNIQSVMLCHPPSLLTVLQALFGALLWKWNFLVGSPLLVAVRGQWVCSGFSTAAPHKPMLPMLCWSCFWACFHFNLLHGLWVQVPA